MPLLRKRAGTHAGLAIRPGSGRLPPGGPGMGYLAIFRPMRRFAAELTLAAVMQSYVLIRDTQRAAVRGVRVSARPVAVSPAHRRVRVAVVPDVLALGGLALLCLVFVVITWRTWGSVPRDAGYDLSAAARTAARLAPLCRLHLLVRSDGLMFISSAMCAVVTCGAPSRLKRARLVSSIRSRVRRGRFLSAMSGEGRGGAGRLSGRRRASAPDGRACARDRAWSAARGCRVLRRHGADASRSARRSPPAWGRPGDRREA